MKLLTYSEYLFRLVDKIVKTAPENENKNPKIMKAIVVTVNYFPILLFFYKICFKQQMFSESVSKAKYLDIFTEN